jgi:hypothetical protein
MKRKDDKSFVTKVHARILKIISTLSESQLEQLLHILEKLEQPEPTDKHEPEFPDKREYPRKNASVYTIYETKMGDFRDFTKNVSVGGVLMEPETTLPLHEDIFMTFFHSNFIFPVRTNGKVVRIDQDGAGVQFSQIAPTMSSV